MTYINTHKKVEYFQFSESYLYFCVSDIIVFWNFTHLVHEIKTFGKIWCFKMRNLQKLGYKWEVEKKELTALLENGKKGVNGTWFFSDSTKYFDPGKKNGYGNINYWSEHTYKKLTGEWVFSTSYSYLSVFHFWSILVEMSRKSSVTTYYNPPYRSDKLSIFKIQVFAVLPNILSKI